jgi:uncharacterized protein YdbL (DUF1318 family)
MMTDKTKMILGLGAGLLLMAGAAGIAVAQSSPDVSAAMSAGKVGEQADGYLGIRSAVSDLVKDEVDAINIKRRAAYTQRAAQKGATVKEMAAAIGCETLATRVPSGRSYLLPDGVWRVKGADPIALPAYCAG